ncbi:uncharacterized protein LOC111692664 [Anoplophora glabripennis]|uniref:uncharacterized protein LOC108913400 n=1 Tax=Anoplophora glabripennis TaxID=217634 RepID=UPI000875116E|nr:uncharacterized protein LOC108913400 [Anoplophora glabripennis]XP_023312515.1 uncharacterized protein LOC111692664 [Anoplophora glabripennis]
MENLFECLSEKPSNEKKLRVLMSLILPEYQNHLVLQDIPHVKTLVRLCRILEDSEKTKREFRPPSSKNVFALEPSLLYAADNDIDSKGASSNYRREDADRRFHVSKGHPNFKRNSSEFATEVRCWNCDRVGHIKRDCKKSTGTPTCYGCGKKGVIRPNCLKCRQTKNANSEND